MTSHPKKIKDSQTVAIANISCKLSIIQTCQFILTSLALWSRLVPKDQNLKEHVTEWNMDEHGNTNGALINQYQYHTAMLTCQNIGASFIACHAIRRFTPRMPPGSMVIGLVSGVSIRIDIHQDVLALSSRLLTIGNWNHPVHCPSLTALAFPKLHGQHRR